MESLDNGTAFVVAECRILMRNLIVEHVHIAAQLTQTARHLSKVLVLWTHSSQLALHAVDLGHKRATTGLELGKLLLS